MQKKLFASLAGVLLALAIAGTAAFASSEAGTEASAGGSGFGATITDCAPITTSVPGVTPTHPVSTESKPATALETRFGVSLAELEALRQETGWGNIFKLFFVAQASGKTPGEVLALRQDEKRGWGVIYKMLDIKPGKKDNLGQSMKGTKPAPSATVVPGQKPNPGKGAKPKDNKPGAGYGRDKDRGGDCEDADADREHDDD